MKDIDVLMKVKNYIESEFGNEFTFDSLDSIPVAYSEYWIEDEMFTESWTIDIIGRTLNCIIESDTTDKGISITFGDNENDLDLMLDFGYLIGVADCMIETMIERRNDERNSKDK